MAQNIGRNIFSVMKYHIPSIKPSPVKSSGSASWIQTRLSRVKAVRLIAGLMRYIVGSEEHLNHLTNFLLRPGGGNGPPHLRRHSHGIGFGFCLSTRRVCGTIAIAVPTPLRCAATISGCQEWRQKPVHAPGFCIWPRRRFPQGGGVLNRPLIFAPTGAITTQIPPYSTANDFRERPGFPRYYTARGGLGFRHTSTGSG